METTWTIPTPDGHTIYGVKNSSGLTTSKAIFIVHGLTGYMNEYALKRAADYFEETYDVYRFNLYDGQDSGRDLIDCTIQTHADDLNTVLSHFGSTYEKIFLIGHSYGGPSIMMANPSGISAVSLWDPSFDLRLIQEMFKSAYTPCGDMYMVNWGTTYLIGKAMYEEAGQLDESACIELSKKFLSPVQVISAGDGFFVQQPLSWHSFGDPNNIREFIAGTVHCFYEGNTCDELLKKTQDWFNTSCL
ncbi:MAG: alpha/beta fold hydrolase [Alphaproteobacteria bacterium]|nr:alpha/beta fold hydrolase [Alphaproteobacteria bacterium]